MDSRWARWPLAIALPVLMLAWVALRNAEEDRPNLDAPFRATHGVASEAEGASLEALLTQAYAVLRSPEYEQELRNLARRYPAIYANRSQQALSTDQVADLVALKAPGSRYVPADVWVTEVQGGFLGLAREGAAGEGRYSDIVLVRPVLNAWREQDVVMRSCAINVAAHEYAHTLSTTPFVYRTAFTDTTLGEDQIPGRRDRRTPVASYFLGALAQCVWLERQGRISASGIAACVEVFGTSSGNPERCRSFAGGVPIAPRPDLPDANPPL